LGNDNIENTNNNNSETDRKDNLQ